MLPSLTNTSGQRGVVGRWGLALPGRGMGWGEALHCLGDCVSSTLTAQFCFLLLIEGAVNRTFLAGSFLLLRKKRESFLSLCKKAASQSIRSIVRA